ncbi:carbohydrate-binding module family 43 protein [Polychaeton citri CBS 116435]|uniref:1,3-beta-glucanosyltransferase n=1 Tax=Polychaeton citri CBS 116435 TaxID=1314669 RepID=A0A9P4UIL2_9PEZI|nr:carbohydrate-binding module family 43 protein [Polychaeton citri CBS 116435]
MKASSLIPSLAAGAIFGASSVVAQSWSDIPSIEAYGQHFFYSNNGSQFYMKGVAYQQNYQANGSVSPDAQITDPLANADNCRRDIPIMKQIFTNVIRVYALDPTADHDDCMQQLADADIYVIADLSEPGTSIQSNDPDWNVPLYNRYTSVVDAMNKYNNVIGFFAGNEVVSAGNQTAAAAFVKAAVRDVKQYISDRAYRKSLGVGYATADVPARDELAEYFACGDESVQIDFWGYNVYSWCGNSSYSASSYDTRVDFFRDYPVPVFFAEYGCNQNIDGGPYRRPFSEVGTLYGDEMTEVFSGGIVYEYFNDENEFGLVSIDGSSVSPYPDFTSLSSQLATISPSITQSSAYTPSNSAPSCPSTGVSIDASDNWAAVATPLPPHVNPAYCACEVANMGCVITDTDASKYGDVFDYLCGSADTDCSGIAHNATTGKYGPFAGCSPQQQLAYIANVYYSSQSKDASACDFSGIAKTQKPATASGCATYLENVGTTGSIPAPTGQQGTAAAGGVTAGSGGNGGSGSGSSGSSSSTSGIGSPSALAPGLFDFGKLLFAFYAVVAVVSGAGILVL